MVRGKRLKKVNGDLEAQKQSVASLELTIGEQNVPFELGVDGSSNGFNLEFANIVMTFLVRECYGSPKKQELYRSTSFFW